MSLEVTAVSADLFFERIRSYLNHEACRIVEDAFELARRAHGDQRRKSGELFFTHPLTVAYYLAEYKLDHEVLVAALLHDVAEDTRVSIAEIESGFGRNVANLVDAVTKFKTVTPASDEDKTQSYTKEQIAAATIHKLLGMTANDVRAMIIKLFDRLHNLRTIEAVKLESRMRSASETLAIYAPIANRLGMWDLAGELGQRALEVAFPAAYRKIVSRLQVLQKKNQAVFEEVQQQIFDCLLQMGLDVRDVRPVQENAYTVYQQLQQNGRSYNEIDSIFRLIVLVGDWSSCYQAMGYLHQLWEPVPETFSDFIAVPRDNLYQSLHTTVVHSNGQRIGLRIRTIDMHEVSSSGILTRWLYAGTDIWPAAMQQRIENFLETLGYNIGEEPHDPNAGVQSVVQDVLGKQIRVYTPKGDVHNLVQGATALDFAYKVHTGLGNQCVGASIGDQRISLNRPLRDGEQVQIDKQDSARPLRAWLDEDLGYLATHYARSHVRRWFRRLPAKQALVEGERILRNELAMLGKSNYSHEDIAQQNGLATVEELYRQLGRVEMLPTTLSTRLMENDWNENPARSLDSVVYGPSGEKYVVTNANGRSLVLCGTCKPSPGDNILGYMRQSNQVTIHQEGCHLIARHNENGKKLKLGWGTAVNQVARVTRIQIDVYDRPGLLYEMTRLMEQEHINISYIHTPKAERPSEVRLVLALEVASPRQLVRILHQVRALYNVYRVRCLSENGYDDSDLLRPSLYRPE